MSVQPYYANDTVTLHAGNCLDVLADLETASVDAVVTDPPYELGFMGRAWDASGVAYNVEVWQQCLRVLKPGGHLAAFGGARTYHRMTCAIEDAGFEIRDSLLSLHWVYGSGFPKSLDVSKAIDKAAGATREVVGHKGGRYAYGFSETSGAPMGTVDPRQNSPANMAASGLVTAPATDDARRWSGFGTALKPAHEPIVLARKPLGGTVAATVLAHGTGALNIDATRTPGTARPFGNGTRRTAGIMGESEPRGAWSPTAEGRWPANVLLTHPPALDAAGDVVGDACADGCVDGCPVAEMDAQSGVTKTGTSPLRRNTALGVMNDDGWQPKATEGHRYTGEGGASRFFPTFRYQAKAPKSERPRLADGTSHPTVKPLALMSWLVTLVTPPGGLVLDPFLGSGTTAEACMIEGFRCVGVELDENHLKLTKARLPGSVQPTLT